MTDILIILACIALATYVIDKVIGYVLAYKFSEAAIEVIKESEGNND